MVTSLFMELTQEFLKNTFDYKDGILYWKIKPFRTKINIYIPAGCIDNGSGSFRWCITIQKSKYLRSRLVFLYHNGFLPKVVDHVDRNPLNDKIENLRQSNYSQNAANAASRKNTSSKYKGVHLSQSKYWCAGIKINGKSIFLGSFKTEIMAALCYNKAAVKHHGEFANLNIIKP